MAVNRVSERYRVYSRSNDFNGMYVCIIVSLYVCMNVYLKCMHM